MAHDFRLLLQPITARADQPGRERVDRSGKMDGASAVRYQRPWLCLPDVQSVRERTGLGLSDLSLMQSNRSKAAPAGESENSRTAP